MTPARVLREVAAKRAILGEHRPEPDGGGYYCTCCEDHRDDADYIEWPCPTVRALAAVYADRPGWREEWTA
jgi:Family of unknown function (DUF6221)